MTLAAARSVWPRPVQAHQQRLVVQVLGHHSRSAFEESLLMMLRQMIPRHVKVSLLAERGFGRTELGDPQRPDRLILVLALACLILLGVGLVTQRCYRSGAWCSTSREQAYVDPFQPSGDN